ncbi:hypothetical protein OKW45_001222 [Paraburkholderia sp. WSM4175]
MIRRNLHPKPSRGRDQATSQLFERSTLDLSSQSRSAKSAFYKHWPLSGAKRSARCRYHSEGERRQLADRTHSRKPSESSSNDSSKLLHPPVESAPTLRRSHNAAKSSGTNETSALLRRSIRSAQVPAFPFLASEVSLSPASRIRTDDHDERCLSRFGLQGVSQAYPCAVGSAFAHPLSLIGRLDSAERQSPKEPYPSKTSQVKAARGLHIRARRAAFHPAQLRSFAATSLHRSRPNPRP